MTGLPWWHDAVIYEVYLRSFQDGDDDGTGDLPGLIRRLPVLAELGVDAVWVTPFFPSPGFDHGYDVSDYESVDPLFGGDSAFERLVRAAHAADLRVLVDVVPNHTSHLHPWFRAALEEGRDGQGYRPYFIWRDPAPDGGPPNNWRSNFGGPAWTLDPDSGQYYHHSYLPEQPELNWRHPPLRQAWRRILELWIERGADGFRIDVAHNLLKDAEFRDNPPAPRAATDAGPRGRVLASRALQRVYDIDQDDCAELFAEWSELLPDTLRGERPLLLGETVLEDASRTVRYLQPGRLDAAMWFGTQEVRFDAADIASRIRPMLDAYDDLGPDAGVPGWFLANHDRDRLATRLGGERRAFALASSILPLPGPFLLYQGEELGMENSPIDGTAARDPIAVRAGEPERSRDAARTPIPWERVPGYGFSTAEPWITHGPVPAHGTVLEQMAGTSSPWQRWRELVAVWGRIRERCALDPVEVLVDRDVLRLLRGPLEVQLNTGGAPVEVATSGHTIWTMDEGGGPTLGAGSSRWILHDRRPW